MKRSVTLVLVLAGIIAITGSVLLWRMSNTGDSLLQKAQLALQTKKYDQAIARAEKYLQEYPDSFEPHVIIANAMIMQGQFDQARNAIELAAKNSADADTIEMLRGSVALARASSQQTTEEVEKLLDAINLINQAEEHFKAISATDARAKTGVLARRLNANGKLVVMWSRVSSMLDKSSAAEQARRPAQRLSSQWDNYYGQLPQWRYQAVSKLLELSTKAQATADTKLSDMNFIIEMCRQVLGSSTDAELVIQARVVLADLTLRKAFANSLHNLTAIPPETCQMVWDITEQVIETDAGNPAAQAIRSRVALIRNLHARQQIGDIFLQLVRLDPDNPDTSLRAAKLAVDSMNPDYMDQLTEAFGKLENAPAEAVEMILQYRIANAKSCFAPGDILRENLSEISARLDSLLALEQFNDNINLQTLSAELAWDMGDIDAVEARLTQLNSAKGRNKIANRLRLLEVRLKVEKDGLETSEADIRQLRSTYPNMPGPYRLQAKLALASENAADLAQAMRELSRIASQPDSLSRSERIELICDIAEISILADVYEAAERQAQSVLDRDPGHARAWLLKKMAGAMADTEDPQALQQFVLAASGTDFEGKVFELIEQAGPKAIEAIELYADAVNMIDKERPDYSERRGAMFNRYARRLGYLLVCTDAWRMAGQDEKAGEIIDKLTPIAPVGPYEAMMLSNTLEAMGDTDAAIAVLEDEKFITDGRCRVQLIDLLSRKGHSDQAIALLSTDDMPANSETAVAIARSMVLAATGQVDALAAELGKIDLTGQTVPNALKLRLVSLNSSIGRNQEALDIMNSLPVQIFEDPQTLSMKIDLLSAVEDIKAIEQIVESLLAGAKPYDMLSVACRVLSEKYFELGRLSDALKLLDRLESAPDMLSDGVNWTEANFQKAALLGRSALYAQSVEKCLEVVYRGRQGNSAGLLILGQALLDMNRREQAVELLSMIEPSSPQYLQGSLLQIDLEKSPQVRSLKLAKLAHLAPTNETILLKRMDLAAGDSVSQAIRIYKDFTARQGKNLDISAGTVFAAAMLLNQSGKHDDAFELAAEAYKVNPSARKALNAAVIGALAKPEMGLEMLDSEFGESPNPAASDMAVVLARAAATSLCVLSDNQPATAKWNNLLNETASNMPAEQRKRFAQIEALCYLVAGGDDYSVFDGMKADGFGTAAIADIKNHKNIKSLARLLLALVASNMSENELAYSLASGLLEDEPTMQWAAAVAMANAADAATLDSLADRVKTIGGDMPVIIKAQADAAREDYAAAAEAALPLIAKIDDGALTVNASLWCYHAGMTGKAIELSRLAWDKYSMAGAANNCAYFMLQGSENDAAILEKAYQLANKAAESIAGDANLLDTQGWIEYLMGNYSQARKHVAKSLVASPGNIATQYHMAIIDLALGDKPMAEKRLQAIVNNAEMQDGPEQEQYAKLAADKLDELK